LSFKKFYLLKYDALNFFKDFPQISLKAINNPNYILLSYKNETFSTLTTASPLNLFNLNLPNDALKLRCENNYDFPVDNRYIWMYIYNPTTNSMETWLNVYKDENQTLSQLFANTRTKATASLNDFLRRIIYNQVFYVQFQCASYYERIDEVYLLAQSKNLTLFRGKFTQNFFELHISYDNSFIFKEVIMSLLEIQANHVARC